ncbi:hypothetical protein [Microcystis aeruginosa]|uniref:hypothetical protein n=1 Tax=Microcystis aeruginosa TaxID=1126 RepID=UPI0020A25471|nr:hypothetical protein [Microcystis aeruginosa]
MSGSLILCVISLTYIIAINLCVLCVSVVRSTPSPAGFFRELTLWFTPSRLKIIYRKNFRKFP